jgi:hypothetical protein
MQKSTLVSIFITNDFDPSLSPDLHMIIPFQHVSTVYAMEKYINKTIKRANIHSCVPNKAGYDIYIDIKQPKLKVA